MVNGFVTRPTRNHHQAVDFGLEISSPSYSCSKPKNAAKHCKPITVVKVLPISPQAVGLRSKQKPWFFPSIPTVMKKKTFQNQRKSLKNPPGSLHFFQPSAAESVRLQAVALELQGADNDVEAITGSAGRRVPRVVEAPQEALQLQRQDAMRDAEKMATQAGWEVDLAVLIWVCLKMLCTPKPNGWWSLSLLNGYNWEYTLFSDKPICFSWKMMGS